MAKPWGKIGAWAEEAEAEEKEQAAMAAAAAVSGGRGDSQNFPSLREAANAKPKKKKMTLQEFTMQSAVVGYPSDEMLRLPTGPKERSAEEMQYGRLGGGFSSYGRSSGPPPGRMRDRDGDGDNSWGGNRRSYGGFDDDRRGPPSRASDFDQPSRADEAADWGMGKKSLPSIDSNRPNRYGSLGGGLGGGASRADEVDDWGAGKKAIPVRSSNFGAGMRDSGPQHDRWGRPGPPEVALERRRLVLDPPRVEGAPIEQVKTNKPSPFGAARPREEVLAEKGLDYKKIDLEIEAKGTSRPTSSHSSRPSSAQSSRSEDPALQGMEGTAKPRPKVNPFGGAKPREVLLEEKGMDWRKIDLELEHRRVDRPETEAEKILKEEINHLKKELEDSAPSDKMDPLQGSREDQTSLHDLINTKEKKLELLIRDLDDKVRFGSKPVDRPGSGGGRGFGFPERPSSQSGRSEDSRNMEFMERPRSRGTVDVWSRQGEDRRAYQVNKERGFLGNRDMDRSRTNRW